MIRLQLLSALLLSNGFAIFTAVNILSTTAALAADTPGIPAGPKETLLRRILAESQHDRSHGCDAALLSIAEKHVPELTTLVNHQETFVRLRAIRMIASLALQSDSPLQHNKYIYDDLIERLSDRLDCESDPTIREGIAATLKQLGPHANKAIPALITCYKTDNNVSVRTEITHALGALRDKVKPAVPLLTEQ